MKCTIKRDRKGSSAFSSTFNVTLTEMTYGKLIALYRSLREREGSVVTKEILASLQNAIDRSEDAELKANLKDLQ